MLSGRTGKLVVYEVLEFICLCVPVFVVLERFASLMWTVKFNDSTAYWLVVASSIAYVTSVSLLIWVPLKFLLLKSRGIDKEITKWRPVPLAYVTLCTLPCFAILLASSKVQMDSGVCFDTFGDLPVSLVLLSLICFDIVETIRPYRLTGKANGLDSDFKNSGPVLTYLEQVFTVSTQLNDNGGANSSVLKSEPGPSSGCCDKMDGISHSINRPYLYSSHSHSGPLYFLWAQDPRHNVFLDTFMFWLDVVEMVRVTGLSVVYFSNWVFPIYIMAFFSILRVVIAPKSPNLTLLGVLTQDLPFLIIRICLISIYGYVTPVLYIIKNLLVCLTFVYFFFLSNLKVFNRGRMF